MIILTPKAQEEITRLAFRQPISKSYLRLSVLGGGCSGMTYKMEFVDKAVLSDRVFPQHCFILVVDPRSMLFLDGITVDFSDGLDGKGFTYDNPNATKSCGCGTSFAVKENK